MTAAIDDGDVRIYLGDARACLAELPAGSVQCIVTSPPFFGLRDYGHAEQIGMEETPEEWVAAVVAVMHEARRVLRDDGVAWIEVGDSYTSGSSGARAFGAARDQELRRPPITGMKPKDLVGAPWMLAFALRADGWYLRSDTIWQKPNPMPESIMDRPTKAHSYVFLLAKSARYFYDSEAIKEKAVNPGDLGLLRGKTRGNDPGVSWHAQSIKDRQDAGVDSRTAGTDFRNARSVWTIPTESSPYAHFATFPRALAERCIKAGTSEYGACPKCGVPFERVIEATAPDGRSAIVKGGKAYDSEGTPLMGDNMIDHGVRGAFNSGGAVLTRTTIGWDADCEHEDPRAVPCVVLDPFMGSGTTALVARHLGRHAVGVELNPDYVEIARKRLEQLSLLAGV